MHEKLCYNSPARLKTNQPSWAVYMMFENHAIETAKIVVLFLIQA